MEDFIDQDPFYKEQIINLAYNSISLQFPEISNLQVDILKKGTLTIKFDSGADKEEVEKFIKQFIIKK